MFKSATSISISGKFVKSDNAILVAPKINIHGLVLRANTEIPQEVLSFFAVKGAKISQFKENGDELVRMSGNYFIKREEIVQLLKKYPNLHLNHKQIKEKQKDIKETLDEKSKKENSEAANFRDNINQLVPNGNIAMDSIFVNADADVYKGRVEIKDRKNMNQSIHIETNTPPGSSRILGGILANGPCPIESQLGIVMKDLFFLSSTDIVLTAKNAVTLGLSVNTTWQNHPQDPSLHFDFTPVRNSQRTTGSSVSVARISEENKNNATTTSAEGTVTAPVQSTATTPVQSTATAPVQGTTTMPVQSTVTVNNDEEDSRPRSERADNKRN